MSLPTVSTWVRALFKTKQNNFVYKKERVLGKVVLMCCPPLGTVPLVRTDCSEHSVMCDAAWGNRKVPGVSAVLYQLRERSAPPIASRGARVRVVGSFISHEGVLCFFFQKMTKQHWSLFRLFVYLRLKCGWTLPSLMPCNSPGFNAITHSLANDFM